MTDTAVCPICEGTGWKIVERAGLSGAERCSCYSEKRAQELQESSLIPPNYEHASLDNFEIPDDNPVARAVLGQALRDVRTFAREFPRVSPQGLLLLGDPGSGKTHLAVAAMKVLLNNGHECIFFDYQNLIDRIRAGWDSTAGTADREAYRSALETEVLVLDDLGSSRPIDWVMDVVSSIITYRYNNRKPLITTTNHPDHELAGKGNEYAKKSLTEIIGERARSRLHEMCRMVNMSGVRDHRPKPVR